MARVFALLAAALLTACSAQGGDAAANDGRVRDLAGILEPEAEARLSERLADAERLYGPQVGIVTVASLDGRSIDDFTADYANQWGLGDKDRGDGLLPPDQHAHNTPPLCPPTPLAPPNDPSLPHLARPGPLQA